MKLSLRIIRMMEGKTRARGITPSALLKEIIKEHYGLKISLEETNHFFQIFKRRSRSFGAKISSSSTDVALLSRRARSYPSK